MSEEPLRGTRDEVIAGGQREQESQGSPGGCGKSDWCLGWKGLLQHRGAGKGGNVDVALAGGRLGIPDTAAKAAKQGSC